LEEALLAILLIFRLRRPGGTYASASPRGRVLNENDLSKKRPEFDVLAELVLENKVLGHITDRVTVALKICWPRATRPLADVRVIAVVSRIGKTEYFFAVGPTVTVGIEKRRVEFAPLLFPAVCEAVTVLIWKRTSSPCTRREAQCRERESPLPKLIKSHPFLRIALSLSSPTTRF
jgi:hypothetical protein